MIIIYYSRGNVKYGVSAEKVVIFLNGFKYLFLSAAMLFLTVFGLTRCGGDIADAETPTGTTVPDSAKITISDDEYTPASEEMLASSTEADPPEADETWAMFLVNAANPLPRGYDDYIKLELVDTTYREYMMDKRCARYMRDMLAAAKEDGIELITSSTYRTYDYQKNNFENSMKYRIDDGMTEEEAYKDTVRAVQLPGQSEHNAGLAADILSNEYTSMDDDGFENTKAFEWLSKHASEYGFILRYPKGKTDITGIIYEPWHYRFVGKYYAKDIEASGLCLEEYFASKGWTDSSGRATINTVYDRNPGLPHSEELSTETAYGDTGEGGDGDDDARGGDEGSDYYDDESETVRAAIPKVPDTDNEFPEIDGEDE